MPIGTDPNADCGLSENAVSLEPFTNVSTNARCIAIVVVWFVAQRFMCTHLAKLTGAIMIGQTSDVDICSQLRRVLAERGITLSVVDMRWGVTEV